MHFKFCPDCGASLKDRILGDEQNVPWCEACSKPWFDMFPVAIIALVYNERGEVLLLRQEYISSVYCNLVSGYITPGESAEECAIREIYEETGQTVKKLTPVMTNWFDRKEMLMIGFFARVDSAPLRLSTEVDSAAWHKPTEILPLLHQRPTSTSRLLALRYLNGLDTLDILSS